MSKPEEIMMSRGSNYANRQAQLKKDEEEIEAMEAALAKGKEDGPDEEEETQPDGEGPETTEVPDEGDTKQEGEDPEADQTQEEDDSELSGEEKTFKKRYGDLRRHSQKEKKDLLDRIEALEVQGSPEGARLPKSDEDIAEWAKKYPDVAAIVETIAEKKATEKFKDANKRLEALDSDRAEVNRDKAETEIIKKHKDFVKLRDADEFHEWVGDQPKWVQDSLYENEDDAKSVIRALDLYKLDKGMTPEVSKEKAKAAAASVDKGTRTKVDKDGTSGHIRESDVSRMTDKEYEENEDRIQKAMMEGSFIYDVTQRR